MVPFTDRIAEYGEVSGSGGRGSVVLNGCDVRTSVSEENLPKEAFGYKTRK